jgi:hypothetical protein
MSKRLRLTRRRILLGAVGAAMGLGSLAFARWLRVFATHERAPWPFRPLPGGEIGALSEAPAVTLVAFHDVLIPSEVAGDPQFLSLAQTVARQTLRELAEARGFVRELEQSASFLDRASMSAHGAAFAGLSLEDRRLLVRELLAPYLAASKGWRVVQFVSPAARRRRHLFRFVAEPLLLGFYISSAGWRLFGYPRRPGECANLVDYQDPPRIVSEGVRRPRSA